MYSSKRSASARAANMILLGHFALDIVASEHLRLRRDTNAEDGSKRVTDGNVVAGGFICRGHDRQVSRTEQGASG